MSTPLVSVVVPAYNHEHLVEECLASVEAQSWQRLELIVVDDRSTDRTAAVVEELFARAPLSGRFERAVLERNERNLNAHASINRGLSLARGELCCILNSDDRFAPARVEELAGALERTGADFAFSGVRIIDERGRDITDEDWFAARLSHTQRAVGAFPSVGWAVLKQNAALSTGNFFFRRSLFERVGPFRGLRYCHDWDFLLRAVLESEPVFVPAPLYDYRVHGTNSFRSLAGVADDESAFVLRSYFQAIKEGRYRNPLAPGPSTWPVVFNLLIATMGFQTHWELARRQPLVAR